MSSYLCYVGDELSILNAIETINKNCGFPNDEGTDTWGVPIKAHEQDFWFVLKPPAQGYRTRNHYFSQNEMIDGIVNLNTEEWQRSWISPIEP